MKLNRTVIAIMAASSLFARCDGQKSTLTKSGLDPRDFATEVNGRPVGLYTLVNPSGVEACITNFGGRVVSLMVPDRNGELRDVVLGHDSIADYINIDGNFGALIGRYGNRINRGRFTLDGVGWQLPRNNFGHCLHGGPTGFHNTVWTPAQTTDSTLVLTLVSPDGDEGFPGEVNVMVTYTLTADNALKIEYEATADKPTILNLTNHSYFNLGGNHSADILDHIVWIDAEGYTPIDSTFIPTGTIDPVEGTPFDFTAPKAIGRDIDADNSQLANGHGYDHNMVFRRGRDSGTPAATVTSPATGIKLEVLTDEPGLQFYTGNFLDGSVAGKQGVNYPFRGAVCLETQHWPDSPNHPEWPSVVVRPGETYRSSCVYRFTTVREQASRP